MSSAVSENLPGVTVLIAARPDETDIQAVAAARRLDYPADKLEILVARGKQPSAQRNAALKAARGELIYFLDDDSVPPPGNLRLAAAHFTDAQVQMAGGPNVCPPDAPWLEQIFALVLASWLAFGPSRARYTPVGRTRPASEKELILCNLVARRGSLVELGGFNEALYPNEENALMDELQKRGGKLMYDPRLVVFRRPRRSLKAFAKMLMTYGRGRAEQFRVNPTFGSALNFVPPLFLVYLLLLVVAWSLACSRAGESAEAHELAFVATAPLALYALAQMAQMVALAARGGLLKGFCAMPLVVLSHVLYGFGFWRGLFTSLKHGLQHPDAVVALETIPR
jgi:succinoglycan biosynthesis protein ExoA